MNILLYLHFQLKNIYCWYVFFFVAEFATLQWSPDETKIVYIAEKKVVKSEPFYKQKPKTSGSKDGADNSIIPVNW